MTEDEKFLAFLQNLFNPLKKSVKYKRNQCTCWEIFMQFTRMFWQRVSDKIESSVYATAYIREKYMQWKQTHPNDYSLLNHFSVTRGFFYFSAFTSSSSSSSSLCGFGMIRIAWATDWLLARQRWRCITMTFLVCAVIKSRRELDFSAMRPITLILLLN